MNDSIAFLAFATIFGMAMFLVGWALREAKADNDWRDLPEFMRDREDRWGGWSRDYPDDVDAAGA